MDRLIRIYFVCVILSLNIQAVSQDFIPLWPEGRMPNSKGMRLEHIEDRERVSQVAIPGMYAFCTSEQENTGAAVLIMPSGGYVKLTYQIAGFQLAKWFNTLGINAYVLFYRLPTSPDLVNREFGPLQDAQRAMKIIRAGAAEKGIDQNRVGVMGASAGGHLAASLSTFDEDYSIIGDSLDRESFHPDFQVLVSPVITMGTYTHKGSRQALLGDSPSGELVEAFSCELNVEKDDPVAFLVHADNDYGVDAMNSVLYYKSLRDQRVSASLHIFPFGGHGIALRNNPGSTNLWSSLCEAWLKEMGIIQVKKEK